MFFKCSGFTAWPYLIKPGSPKYPLSATLKLRQKPRGMIHTILMTTAASRRNILKA